MLGTYHARGGMVPGGGKSKDWGWEWWDGGSHVGERARMGCQMELEALAPIMRPY
jgi:hypothetical protein